jgi:acetyltransferase-like isoleucine patch superfamily enzyme
MKYILAYLRKTIGNFFLFFVPELRKLLVKNNFVDERKHIKIYFPFSMSDVQIGSHTYIAMNSIINKTSVGKFCSIGPNLLCGWGIHPTNGISTAPMFYSTLMQNGMSLSEENKTIELKRIIIENDVFIGANVTILDGVTIHNGAVIGAGAVVSKDIPPYAIAIGVPIKIQRYRFDEETIQKLLKIKWWDFSDEKLNLVEKYFFDIQTFIKVCSK